MALLLGVTSGKGGTGKSTVSVALSLAFEKMGKSVLVIDLDEGLRCLDIFYGLDGVVVFDLADALNKNNLEDCIYKAPSRDHIYLMPAPSKAGSIDKEKFCAVLEQLRQSYDVIILDFPAGADFSLYEAIGKDIQYIAVCNPDNVSVRDARVVCDNLPKTYKSPRLLLNKFDIELIRRNIYSGVDDIIDKSGLRLIGIVPSDLELNFLANTHTLKNKGRSMRAFSRIAGRLCGEDIRLPKPKKI